MDSQIRLLASIKGKTTSVAALGKIPDADRLVRFNNHFVIFLYQKIVFHLD